MALPLDMKVCWNSILPMVERYIAVKRYIEQALKIFGDDPTFTTTIYNDAVLKLSEDQSNLMTAEASLQYIVQCLGY